MIEALARDIRQIDNSRVILSALEFSEDVAVNAYYHQDLKQLQEIDARWNPDRPYIVSEFGPEGYWETNLADWFAPMEQALPDKIATLKAGYEECRIGDSDQCLGGLVFYWGQK